MISIGSHVQVKVNGRVAKKKDGRVIKGEFISFKNGDRGTVIGKVKMDFFPFLKYRVLLGGIKGEEICLMPKDVEGMDDFDEKLSKDAIDKCSVVSKRHKDLSDNADY